jgi:hypothetical protein
MAEVKCFTEEQCPGCPVARLGELASVAGPLILVAANDIENRMARFPGDNSLLSRIYREILVETFIYAGAVVEAAYRTAEGECVPVELVTA